VFERQLQNTVRVVVASHADGSRILKRVEVDAAGPDHKGLRAIRVGLASGVLRRKALVKVVVALQENVDVLGHQEINPGLDTGFWSVLASAGEVRLMGTG